MKRPIPAPQGNLSARIVGRARTTPQRTPFLLQHVLPSLFSDPAIPAPLFLCVAVLGLGLGIGLSSPLAADMTDVTGSFGTVLSARH